MFYLTILLNDLSSNNVEKRRIKLVPEKGSQSTWACWKSGVMPAVSWRNSWVRERWHHSVKVVPCNGSPLQGSSDHCFTFISCTQSSLFYQDWELLFISSLPGSQVSEIASLLPLLQEKSLWRKSLVPAWFTCICFAPLAFGKTLCCTGTE